MKKKTPDNDELRPHYDFDYEKMKPNRFAGEKKVYKQTSVKTPLGTSSHPKGERRLRSAIQQPRSGGIYVAHVSRRREPWDWRLDVTTPR